MKTMAYVYKWTELSTGRWYIGSRTAIGCHPNDGYICSSKIIKKFIMSNPDNWKREILETGTPEEMLSLEHDLLTVLGAHISSYSYNGSTLTKPANPNRKPYDESAFIECVDYYIMNGITIPFDAWFATDCTDVKCDKKLVKKISTKIDFGYSVDDVKMWLSVMKEEKPVECIV